MTKRELIEEITLLNPTATPVFLARFEDRDLAEYLSHLHWLNQPPAGSWNERRGGRDRSVLSRRAGAVPGAQTVRTGAEAEVTPAETVEPVETTDPVEASATVETPETVEPPAASEQRAGGGAVAPAALRDEDFEPAAQADPPAADNPAEEPDAVAAGVAVDQDRQEASPFADGDAQEESQSWLY